MKKTIAAILAGALCLTALTACGGSKTDSSAADSSSAAAGDDKTITVGATPTPHAEDVYKRQAGTSTKPSRRWRTARSPMRASTVRRITRPSTPLTAILLLRIP